MVTETKKLIVVIGMHRTGTSLVTRGLQVLGVNLGDNLLPAMAEVNAKGFWEDADINAFNIDMLHALESEWDFLAPITDAHIAQLRQLGYFLKAVELLRSKVAQTRIFGLKDPRIAKLLPFWDLVFTHCEYDVNYLLTIRHPMSVAKSLQKRDGFNAKKSYLLWFTHVVTALAFARSKRISLVDYDYFMQHPASEIKRLAQEFNLPVDERELEVYLNEFVDDSLRHTQYELNDLQLDKACPNMVQEIYQSLLNVARGEQALSSNEIAAQIDAWSKSLAFAKIPFSLIDTVSAARDEIDRKVDFLEQETQQQKQFIAGLEQFNAERVQQVNDLYAQLENLERERAAQIENLYAETRERDAHIAHLNGLLGEQHSQFENYKVHMDVQLQERQAQVEAIATDAARIQQQNAYLVAQIELITQSKSWRLTKPLRFIARTLAHGLTVESKSQLLLLLRNINHKLPASVQRANRAIFGGWVRSIVRPTLVPVTAESAEIIIQSADAQKNVIPPAVTSGTDFIVWGVIDWHFRHQRPQQIAQALAGEGDRVFYISSNLVEAKSAGFTIESLDSEGRLYQVNLCVATHTVIYHHAPSKEVTQQLLASVGELLLWAKAAHVINLVQHPFWHSIANQLPNSQLVYDCMDHHEGFENTGKEIVALEHALFKTADLTIVTSGYLDEVVAKHTPHREIIRNAGEYEYFSKAPGTLYRDEKGRKIIGYYGAIAEWFDIELIRQLSQRFSDCLILLIGADTVNAKAKLKSQHNVVFVGEVPYQELTHYLYAFDVCLLPFKVIPLILATNPVKVYEYLGAGKPVVAVDVPEIKQFGNLVRVGKNHEHFVEQVAELLAEPVTDQAIAERKAFAEQQTWHHRARDLSRAVKKLHDQPKVSVIVVTYNNLDLTKQCLSSLERLSHYPNFETIVVDNASSDDSPQFLREWATQGENRILVLNPDNKGFAAGNNQGLELATGEYLVLLNNDTHVTPGWISTLVKHMQRNPNIGLLGPVTGNIGNEAKIAISYKDMEEMLAESSKYTLRHIGKLTPLRTAAFFCVMISRPAFEKVGLLDEAFGIGFFEDDDYCRRVEQAGYEIYCADDVFIHHHLSASFNKLKIEARQKLFEQNKVTYEAKWGPWVPHKYRPGVS